MCKTASVVRAILAAWCALAAGEALAAPDFQLQPAVAYIGEYGQTSIYRAQVTLPEEYWGFPLSIELKVADTNVRKGSGGVFTGLDLDCILYDFDGLFNGNEIALDATYSVYPGARRYPTLYDPTAKNPGVLFGLDASGQLRPDVATLDQCDANFRVGIANLTVDSSRGWVSLGDAGYVLAIWDGLQVSEGGVAYIYIGDAGRNDEPPALTLRLLSAGVPEPSVLAVVALGALGVLRKRDRRAA